MGATKFSKVDGNKAFFGMHLTEEASLLTTFNTHLRRYRFLHVPFGLKMSQDIFQMRMDDIVANAPVYWPSMMMCSSTERMTETMMQTS